MQMLVDKFGNNFIWIDHHKRKIDEVESKIKGISGLRDPNHSACALSWLFFGKQVPEFARYVEDADLWRHVLPNTKELNIGLINLKSKITNDMIKYVYELLDDFRFNQKKQELIARGKCLEEYISEGVSNNCRIGKIYLFEGYRTFVINASMGTNYNASYISEYVFSNPDKFKDVKVVLIWQRIYLSDKVADKCSIRSNSDDVDVSLIAKKFGGNGHQRASGFIVDNIDQLKLQDI